MALPCGVQRGLAALGLVVALAPQTARGQNVTEVQVAPPSITLKAGERMGLLATAFDRAGNVIPTVRVLWSSNNLQVAKVDNNGTVTGLANGVAIIDARVGNKRGTAAVQVVGGSAPPTSTTTGVQTPPPSDGSLAGQPSGTGAASVLRIEPPTIYLQPSENIRASPRALKDDGTAAAPLAVTWKSLRPEIASVDGNGVVVALSPGQGTIQLTSAAGLTATAPVVVQQADLALREGAAIAIGPGVSDTLHVIVPTQGARGVSPLTLQWNTADPTVARVSLTGVVTGVGPGRTTVTVSGFLQTKTIDVVVHRPVELLAVRPKWQDEVLLPIQGTGKFEAQALAADRTPVADAPLQWSVADTAIASYDAASGMLTGRKAGQTQLVVRGPGAGLAVTWNVRVIAAGVRLSVARVGLSLNRRIAVRATYMDSSTVIGPATGLTWTSENPQVATANDSGVITAVSYGRARAVATAPGGKRGTVDVFVQGEIVMPSTRAGSRFQLFAAERGTLTQWRRVSEDTLSATDPAFSPDGSRIAFAAARGIYVMDADGGNPVRVTTGSGNDNRPQFLPDLSAIIFQSDRGGAGIPQIWTQSLQTGGAPVQLTQGSGSMQPTVSPDGEIIAFASTRDGSTNIWLMAKDGTNQREFTRSSGNFKSLAPRFLRDGSLFYLVQGKEGGRTVSQVMRAELTTGRVSPVTGTELSISDFAAAPGGDLLALLATAPGSKGPARLYIQALTTGSAAVPITTTGAEQQLIPAFMP